METINLVNDYLRDITKLAPIVVKLDYWLTAIKSRIGF